MRIVLLALVLVLVAGPSQAGPVVAAFTAVATWVSGLGVVGSALLRVGLGLAVSAFTRAKQPDAETPGIVTEQTLTGGTNPDGFVLGTYATGGMLVAPDGISGKKDSIRSRVFDLGGIPGATLERIIVDGEAVTLRPGWRFIEEETTGTTGRYGALVDEYTQVKETRAKYADNRNAKGTEAVRVPAGTVPTDLECKLWVQFYDGMQTAADPTLLAECGDDPDYPWTADMIGRGRCYAIVRARLGTETLTAFPEVRFVLRGIGLYDPRKDSSVGGDGPHRWGQFDTYEPADNGPIQIYNLLRGIPLRWKDGATWRVTDVYGGGANADDIPLDSVFSAANEADRRITEPGGVRRQFRTAFEVQVDQEPFRIIDEIKRACLLEVVDHGGKFYFHCGAPALPVYFFTDDDVIVSEASDFDPFPGLADTINSVSISYPDPTANFEAKESPPVIRPALEAADGGRRLGQTITFAACPFPVQAQRIAKFLVEDARRFRRHNLTLPPDAAHLRPMLTVSWTSAANGYVSKLFQIGTMAVDLHSYASRMALREVDPSDADWNLSDAKPFTAIGGKLTVTATSAPIGVTFKGVSRPDGVGRARRPAIWANWGDALRHDIEMRFKDAPDVTHRRLGVETPEGGYLFDDVLPAADYQGRVRFATPLNTGVWTGWINVRTPDLRLSYGDLADDVVLKLEKFDTASQQLDDAIAQARADFLAGDETVKIEIDTLRSESLAAVGIVSDFEQDGRYWSRDLSGAPGSKRPLHEDWSFSTNPARGRTLRISFNVAGDRVLAPRTPVKVRPGDVVRMEIDLRRSGSGDPSGAPLMKTRFYKLDGAYAFVSSAAIQEHTTPTTGDFETIRVEYTVSGADAAYVVPHLYVLSSYNAPGLRLEIFNVRIRNVTEEKRIEAMVEQERIVRERDDDALAAQITTTSARLATTEAKTNRIESSYVTEEGALARVEGEVSVKYGSLSAMAVATSFAQAGANRLAAGFIFDINGSRAMTIINGATGSEYPNVVKIGGAMIADTISIGPNAVSFDLENSRREEILGADTPPDSWRGYMSIAIPAAYAARVIFAVTVAQFLRSGAGGTPKWEYRLIRRSDGETVATFGGTTFQEVVAFPAFVQAQPSGTTTYDLQYKLGAQANINNASIIASVSYR